MIDLSVGDDPAIGETMKDEKAIVVDVVVFELVFDHAGWRLRSAWPRTDDIVSWSCAEAGRTAKGAQISFLQWRLGSGCALIFAVSRDNEQLH